MTETAQPDDAQPADAQSANEVPWKSQLIVAVALLGLFFVLAVWMLATADASDAVWQHRVYVFGSVEALVFAAVGWLFGREVNRTQAETARQDAKQAKTQAEQKAEEAAIAKKETAVAEQKGRGLADAIDLAGSAAQVAAAPAPRSGDVGLNDPAAAAVTPPQLDALQTLARRLYPDR